MQHETKKTEETPNQFAEITKLSHPLPSSGSFKIFSSFSGCHFGVIFPHHLKASRDTCYSSLSSRFWMAEPFPPFQQKAETGFLKSYRPSSSWAENISANLLKERKPGRRNLGGEITPQDGVVINLAYGIQSEQLGFLKCFQSCRMDLKKLS